MTGGYSGVAVDANATALLTKALANETLYGADVTQRVCFSSIDLLQQQIVAGVNYVFTVTACEVEAAQDGQGKCPTAVLTSCAPEKYVITVYEQSWTNTVKVSSIKLKAANGESSGLKGSSDSGSSHGANGGSTTNPLTDRSAAPTSGVANVVASCSMIALTAGAGALW